MEQTTEAPSDNSHKVFEEQPEKGNKYIFVQSLKFLFKTSMDREKL